MDYSQKSPSIISFCTGIRGIERGLERAFRRLGWMPPDVIVDVEIESFIIANLIEGMESGRLAPSAIWSDLKTFPAKRFRGLVDFFTGGYPCQGFSHAGKRLGTEDPRHLFPYLGKHIDAARPLGCFFENVGGHLSLGFAEVSASLRDLGYRVEAGIFTAEEVGAPHKRERLFILAIRNDVELANTTSPREWGGERNFYQADGRPYGELQQQFDGSSKQDLANATGIHEAGNPNPWQSLELDETSGRMEQGRHELGNTPNDGHIAATQQGSGRKDSERPKEREVEAIEPAGTVGSGGGPGIQGGEELANAGIDTLEGREIERGVRGKFGRTGQELANGNGIGCLHIEPEIDPTKAGIDAQRDLAAGDRDELGNATGKESGTQPIGNEAKFPMLGIASGNEPNVWPSGPNQPQHEWEQPRTIGYTNRLPRSIRKLWHSVRPDLEKIMGPQIWEITNHNIEASIEPALGSSVDGYEYREYFLRALGNSVVEQTAELAFLTLLQKHIDNHGK